jgi:hypothetical protein
MGQKVHIHSVIVEADMINDGEWTILAMRLRY